MTSARPAQTRAARRLAVLLIATLTMLGGLPASAETLSTTYSATYAAGSVPAAIAGGTVATVQVTLSNTGTASWNAAGTNPVNLSYHWYDAAGNVAAWDGVRTALAADVPPGGSTNVNAQVLPPLVAGTYQLRFALVKEGVTWFAPGTAYALSVSAAYAATFGAITLPRLLAGATISTDVPVTNAGGATWSAFGSNPVNLAYHWYDAQGRTVVWDGLRTSIGADVTSSTSRTLSARVIAPATPGAYALSFDLVREGAGWFGTPQRLPVAVEVATWTASYGVAPVFSGLIGERKTLAVTLTNTGNVTWNSVAPNPVNLSYHWYDAGGNVVVWDGLRTALSADVAPGGSQTVSLSVLAPARTGTYALKIELVREGVAWFSGLGASPATLTASITSGFDAGYGADTTPSAVASGIQFPVQVLLFNTGQRTWPAAGATPVHLAYHVYDSAGNVVVWDGIRGELAKDVPGGEQLSVTVNVVAPTAFGTYVIAWDLVQEGVTWFSAQGVVPKRESLSVTPGVTLYGKGWGHGVGLSQWGAQGWATGAGGTPLTGEQIVLKYYPGATITPLASATSVVKPFRVLLSTPSTGCNGRSIYSLAQMRSDGGLKVVKNANPSVVLLTAAPTQTVRVWVDGTTLKVMDEWSAQVIYSGSEQIALVQRDTTKPITIDQKMRFYRGNLLFEVAGFGALRVVNYVNADDYTQGVVPAEMLIFWHLEALKAQAYAARTYAASKQASMAAVAYDLRDDTSDQCYGGASVETTNTNTAAAATAGKILTYNGAAIRAYFASSDGGATDSNGCVWGLVRVGSTWACGAGEPYLTSIQDPADPLATDARGPNPHRAWLRTFFPEDLRAAVLAASGVDIGAYVSIDLSNRAPGGHVISVRIRGTAASVDLRADTFLRTTLGLKSTMVRLTPF